MAYLSATTVESGRSVRLEVLNRGPDAAVLTGVEAPTAPTFLLKANLPEQGIRLEAGEAHRLFVSPSLGAPSHVRVVLTWIDDSGLSQRTIFV